MHSTASGAIAALARAQRSGAWRPWAAVVVLLLAVVAAAAWGAFRGRPVLAQAQPGPSRIEQSPAVSLSGSATAAVAVHVAGAVVHPGVVTVPAGSRVADAVSAAGGPLPGVNLDALNLARKVTDGDQVVINAPAPAGATSGAEQSTAATPSGSGVIDLNTATAQQLEDLPRIGPATAEKILAYRKEHGRFTTVEELLEVPGIGERTLAGLRELVRV